MIAIAAAKQHSAITTPHGNGSLGDSSFTA